ncbi:MAG: type II secretion system F family protein [Patescibacteria group bacterium]|jgi:type IV pilus assembly protein PilC|nr:type II secretion system F family protein [Patescibacteria group bacterium]
MPKFSYSAKNAEGKIKKGEMESADRKESMEILRKDGFWATSLEVVKKKKVKSDFFGGTARVSLKSKMVFSRHLGVMISSGLSLSRSLNILATQEKNKGFKKIIFGITDEVKRGISLADAMKKYPKVFDSVFTSMIGVGEVGGNLEEILKLLSDQMEKDHKLISKVKGALIYPAVIVCLMIVIGILMMMFVIPKITKIFEDFGSELPFLTRVVLGISDFMAANILVTLGSIIGVVLAVVLFYKTSVGTRIFHKFFIKVPSIGGIVTQVNTARFSRILSSLLKSGVSLVESLRITSDTLGNYHFKKAVKQASEDVQKGITLSDVLKKNNDIFPHLVVQMIEVGEETGKTPEILLELAIFYEDEVQQVTQNLSSVIEPILMIVIGGAVGFFAIAIIQPIYSLVDTI